MTVRILSATLAMLAMLSRAVEPTRIMLVCAAAIASALPGVFAAQFAKNHRAAWANWLAFGDMLPLSLPLACLFAWPELAIFAICHHLTRLLPGGWLLRRDGVRCEKNFTLILAYRQTLAHCRRFPGEVHPHENPLFQPARNAQNALAELLPLAGLLLGWLLNAMGLRMGNGAAARIIAAVLTLLLAVSLIRTRGRKLLPSRPPTLKCALLAIFRAALLTFSFALFREIVFPQLFTVSESHVLILCAMLPVASLPDDLRRGSADQQLCELMESATQWGFILWLIAAVIAGILSVI